jgi:tRNA(Ile)-lysidine synthase
LSLLERYTNFINQHQLFQPSENLLLAISGGVDSVVLAWLTKKAGYHFGIAHCNFQLRGEESKRDEAFVISLAQELNIPVYVKRFETLNYADEKGLSIQVAARELRYGWFKELLEGKAFTDYRSANTQINTPFHYLITAHHKDDNIETVLMNFCKGTGIRGLKGILNKQDNIIRPLLFASKEEILNCAQENNLSWVEDSSNSEAKYTRNYFRKEVIPTIEKIFPGARENVAASIERYKDVEMLYNEAIQQHKKKLLEIKGQEIHIPVLKLQKSKPTRTILYEIIKEYGFTSQQVAEVGKLLSSETGKYIASPTHRIIRNRAWLIISPLNDKSSEFLVVEKEDNSIYFDLKLLRIKKLKGEEVRFSTDNSMATINAEALQYPLILRKWKAGDYFYPLGMRKKKKLSRFFIDQKLSLTEKENVWVVESHKKIVWVVGQRIDDRFKITPTTKEALQLSIANLLTAYKT